MCREYSPTATIVAHARNWIGESAPSQVATLLVFIKLKEPNKQKSKSGAE